MTLIDTHLFPFILMLAVAIASGFVGIFALMRHMTLASDAMSHVALPGLGLAIVLKINPLLGAAVALILGAVIVWALEHKTKIPTETIIGVLFSAALAVGSLLASSEELIDAFFGEVKSIGGAELGVGILFAVGIIAFIFRFKDGLALSVMSKDLARTLGINTTRLDLYFILIFVLNIMLGLQFLGVLLMGSLIIIPAATARNVAKSLTPALLVSAGVACLSVAIGFFISLTFGSSIGPTIITVAAGIFSLSLFLRR